MSNQNELLIEVSDLTKVFQIGKRQSLTACNKINLNIYQGRTLGIVGESGCGKTTLARMLMQLETPTEGKIVYRGSNIVGTSKKMQWEQHQHIQMVFQDPLMSLPPKMKVKDIITEPLFNYKKIKKSDKEAKAKELLAMVGLGEEFLNRYPYSMSGGQRQRVGIARALAINPEILVCDESTSALDVSIQKKIVQLLVEIQKQRKISMVFISHDLAMIQSFSHQIAVMYHGNIVELLPGEKVAKQSKHPYTKLLLDSIFSKEMIEKGEELNQAIGGLNNSESSMLGCPFANRCPNVIKQCQINKPELKAVGEEHWVACHLMPEA